MIHDKITWALLSRFEGGCNDDIFAWQEPNSCGVLSNLKELLGSGYGLVVELKNQRRVALEWQD